MTLASFPQIKPLSTKPTPAELADFSRSVRAALGVLQSVQQQIDSLGKQVTEVAGAASESSTSSVTEIVEAPTTAADLDVTPGFAKINLEWTAATYKGHAYTEIWRAQVDDLGQAVFIDMEQYHRWTDDNLPNTALGTTYYYWIRHVNKNDDKGAFNAVAGTVGSTSDDPEYLLQLAADKWQSSTDYAQGALAMPTAPNGFCYEVTGDGGSSGEIEPTWPTAIEDTVTDGDLTWTCKAIFSFETFFKLALIGGVPKLTLKELFLADGVIKRAMIGLAEIDDARMANCSVSKLLAGIIKAAGIYIGNSGQIHIDGANERITVNDGTYNRVILGKLSNGWGLEVYNASGEGILTSGGVPSSMVGGLGAFATLDQITLANINTFIAGLAVDTLHLAQNAVTVPESYWLASSVTLSDEYTDVADVSIDSQGQPIFFAFSATGHANGIGCDHGSTDIDMRILEGSTTVVYEALGFGGFFSTKTRIDEYTYETVYDYADQNRGLAFSYPFPAGCSETKIYKIQAKKKDLSDQRGLRLSLPYRTEACWRWG